MLIYSLLSAISDLTMGALERRVSKSDGEESGSEEEEEWETEGESGEEEAMDEEEQESGDEKDSENEVGESDVFCEECTMYLSEIE